ncbi:hypothetical protein ABZ568_28640 [Streptomyces olindensis]|uniref:Uncharacterized protein n=1 Tax=Streptomyces olindensis TaxID=358823 RepID=A0ABV2Y219_9ACTN
MKSTEAAVERALPAVDSQALTAEKADTVVVTGDLPSLVGPSIPPRAGTMERQ